MFRREKRRSSLLFSSGYLTPRGWALELDDTKVEAPWSTPTGKEMLESHPKTMSIGFHSKCVTPRGVR
ncbi:hypothetical protein FZC84_09200 [Rossellomorea vietnamensis]|uniref:Uncharacterized protein n=1 Tax=Rossellomorea vietnamensis TaxID=218284 RepID=A0A5D4ME98_9BACI|nr:hypothetical protein FZC84_09200 [Rossellomorea vietnamensis]